MITTILRRCLVAIPRTCRVPQIQQCRSVFGIHDLEKPSERPEIKIEQVQSDQHQMAIDMIKQYYLPEHVLVRSRNMHLDEDCAIDAYLISLIKQGNSLYAKAENGQMAGICIGFASSPIDVTNLRSYAFYRQIQKSVNSVLLCIVQLTTIANSPATHGKMNCNVRFLGGVFLLLFFPTVDVVGLLEDLEDPNTRDFLYFTAKLQETPNLWDTFKQQKIFEIKMITVAPEFRKQGLATSLAESVKSHANDQGYNVIRMDCINQYDYKVAERCMLRCIVKFPLHRLRGTNAPFVKRSSPHNCCVRVYVDSKTGLESPDFNAVKQKQKELESLIE